MQIVDYKGVQGIKKYIPYSEYATMRFGNGHSQYWHAATMKHLRSHLDMPLEASLGYFYTDIFNRCAPSPAVDKNSPLNASGRSIWICLSNLRDGPCWIYIICQPCSADIVMCRWLLDKEEARIFQMPGAIHWGYEDKNLTGTELIAQDDGTHELIAGGPALQQAAQADMQETYQGGAVEIVEA